MSQGPNDFGNGKNDSLQRHAVLEMAEMGHYGTVQILKRRIDKNDEARDGCRGPHILMLSFHYHLVCQVPVPIGV